MFEFFLKENGMNNMSQEFIVKGTIEIANKCNTYITLKTELKMIFSFCYKKIKFIHLKNTLQKIERS